MEYVIRKRKKEDCKEIAHVVTISWNETYKEIVPDWFLKELYNNEDERTDKSLNEFDEKNNNYLVLEIDKRVVGFVWYGKSSDQDFDNCGEIIALYILKEYQGYGLGRALVEHAREELKKLGFNKFIIACLKGNPSNEFYKHIGGKYIKDGEFKRLSLKENIYYYEI